MLLSFRGRPIGHVQDQPLLNILHTCSHRARCNNDYVTGFIMSLTDAMLLTPTFLKCNELLDTKLSLASNDQLCPYRPPCSPYSSCGTMAQVFLGTLKSVELELPHEHFQSKAQRSVLVPI